MQTQTPTFKQQTYVRQPVQAIAGADIESIKLLIVAAALAALACIAALGISSFVCTYFSPASEFTQPFAK